MIFGELLSYKMVLILTLMNSSLRHLSQELKKAQDAISGKDKASLEDYIDSVCVGMDLTEEKVKGLTIRKFWRYVKRINKRDIFNVMKSAESTGFVKFKEPVQ